ncbi:MAG TPA: cyclic nucleotide-binding domain-containing protein [Mycobacteriales bacterium]|nr:cyclic nucleotide-binding domain-containing protein [Mycobacteriales bacterium]
MNWPPGNRSTARRARELARLAPFVACPPRDLKFIARWGDLISVEAGQVLARRDYSDWWFFVVVSGALACVDKAGATTEIGPGEHFGADTILGLRPQRQTASATGPSVLFVLGPRYLLSLLSVSAHLRRGLFPAVDLDAYDAFAKRLYDEGQIEWRRLAREHRHIDASRLPRQPRTKAKGLLALAPPKTPSADRLPGRPLTIAEAVHALAALPDPPPVTALGPMPPMPRRWRLAAVAAVVGAISGVLFGYHPPRLVLSAGRPIDVAADIQIVGAPTYLPHGHYLLLWVHAGQPTLAGLLTAWVQRRPTVAYDATGDSSVQTEGREEYLDSQHEAISLALAAARLDPRHVVVRIRDRGFGGPSAGLVYALALDDLLTPGDLSQGRVIAVTGAIATDGRVEPIGWLMLKVHGASAGRATLLLVPAGQLDGATAWSGTACGVKTLRDALRAVASTRKDNACVTSTVQARR